jgi:uncharacterized protein YukE
MAEEKTNYTSKLEEALASRKEWLEKTELVKLKEDLRIFQISYASLYNIYLKKKLINEDPYKQETKISELEVPDVSPLIEAKRIEQVSIRLSNFDSQLDFLVNFYQLGVDFLNLERVKRIVGLIRYVDWLSLTPDSKSPITTAVSELTTHSKSGVDAITLSIIGESLSKLSKFTVSIMTSLKDLSAYYREAYKLKVRVTITQAMSPNEVNAANIKKKISSAMPGTPFYQELIDELIKEDYSSGGAELREAILKNIKVAEEKPKIVKAPINFKNILLDGIQVIGSSSVALNEIGIKFEENEATLENQKKGFMKALKNLIRQITHAEPEDVFYNVEYIDATRGVPVKEKLNFHQFRDDMNKKSKILASFMRGPAYTKLSAMTEEQVIGYLEKNIRDVQNLHRTLNALDDFFKGSAGAEFRDKIKGIKPELSTIKNSFLRANQLRYDYSAKKEEEEQLRHLGVMPADTEE